MSHNENDKHSLIFAEILALLGEIEDLAKFMLEKTARAEVITTRDKINRHLDHYRKLAHDDVQVVRQAAINAASGAATHVKKHPVYTTITFFSVAWLVWRFINLSGKK